jgi:hypothetical protein
LEAAGTEEAGGATTGAEEAGGAALGAEEAGMELAGAEGATRTGLVTVAVLVWGTVKVVGAVTVMVLLSTVTTVGLGQYVT